jgi:tetraprenyl-beta-curcumene synthase
MSAATNARPRRGASPGRLRSRAVPEAASALTDRRLALRAGVALAVANVRYWLTVAPLVRAELSRWERRARAIRDPALQALALETLHGEGFTAEVAAMLATLTPRAHRGPVVQAIVALEVMYDYLDGLTELPSPDPLRDGRRLYAAFTDAIDAGAGARPESVYRLDGAPSDGGYLRELSGAVRSALAQLPATAAIGEVAQASAARGAQAQIRTHAAARVGTAQLERWARREAQGTALQWRELLAGAASSVLALHALIALAGDSTTTPARAAEIDVVYLSISALSTMLDGLIDYERDRSAGEPGFVSHYETRDLLTRQLVSVAEQAARQARGLPNESHHVMVLLGVIAYYTSAPGARGEFAGPVTAHLHERLRPGILPTLAVMRLWRIAKRVRHSLAAVGARPGAAV